MSVRTLAAGATSMWLVIGSGAHAGDISACDDALVRSTYNRSERQFRDWRLAQSVSQDAYDKISHDGSANAVIYGVPMGAKYSDFQENIRRFASSSSESFTTNEATNVMWTGLDPNSATAYSSCVDAIANQGGLTLTVKSATANDVVLSLRWRPRSVEGSNDPPAIRILWSGELSNLNLPTTASQGEGAPFVILRPARESSLAVRSGGLGSSVTITPIRVSAPRQYPKVIYSGRQAVPTAVNVRFDFAQREYDLGGGVSTSPWVYTAPQSGKVNINANFQFSRTSYASCAIYVLGRSQPIASENGVDRTRDGSNPVTYCNVRATTDVKRGEQIQVDFGQALYVPTGSLDVSGRVSVEYIE